MSNHDHTQAFNPLPQDGKGHWRFVPERTVCDGGGCEQDTPLVSLGWRKSWLTLDLLPNGGHTFGMERFRHFCSWTCLAAFAQWAQESDRRVADRSTEETV